MKIERLHHAQITIPIGKEAEGRAFYCDLLGLQEIEKPDSLKANGGFWLQLAENIQIHVGVEADFDRSQTKAHLAYQVDDVAAWCLLLREHGYEAKANTPIEGFERIEFRDPFGNRIELIQAIS